ncbi:unnamed protein product [Acanthoscelides obtectus]|uniref:Uncharacterized protein n=1 Tax=Acanthoscelides obtectus TaxID=200917 RepID=A0A9P0LZV6_ACAOB|nr:unnamed protein product [Acanthoscelides obtectus]CAK1656611.1 hypothetical protein AOBTE_LOCUS19829 [Acanthoscelides obtectus]
MNYLMNINEEERESLRNKGNLLTFINTIGLANEIPIIKNIMYKPPTYRFFLCHGNNDFRRLSSALLTDFLSFAGGVVACRGAVGCSWRRASSGARSTSPDTHRL